MENINSKRRRIVQLLLVAVIVITAVFSVPSVSAKYSKTISYPMTIQTKLKYELVNAFISNTPGAALGVQTITASRSGYYADLSRQCVASAQRKPSSRPAIRYR